jgi:carbohydrate-binding DOMON domain-containing protein
VATLSQADGALSAALEFSAQPPWAEVLRVDDPAGDDTGPSGQYRYPTDPSFATLRSMDLHQVRVRTLGGALQLELTMAGISTVWNPPLGFDHLALTLFIELPGEPGGSRLMPLQSAELPGDMRWHRRLRANGWTNALFSAEGATAEAEGTAIIPTAQVLADHTKGTITLTLPATALGRKTSLAGVRLYLNTWDYDAGYRALGPEAQAWAMGGASGEARAKVMDDTPILTLP